MEMPLPFPRSDMWAGNENESLLKSQGGTFQTDVSSRVENMSVGRASC